MGNTAKIRYPMQDTGVFRNIQNVRNIGRNGKIKSSSDFSLQEISRLFEHMEEIIDDREIPGKMEPDLRTTTLSAIVNFGKGDEELIAANDPGPARGSLLRRIFENGIRIAIP